MSPRSQLKWRRRGHHYVADIEAHEATPRNNSLVHGIAPCTTNTTLDAISEDNACGLEVSARGSEGTTARSAECL